MEKWHLAAIISNAYKPELILPISKPSKALRSQNQPVAKNKIIILFQSILRKTTEVIALF